MIASQHCSLPYASKSRGTVGYLQCTLNVSLPLQMLRLHHTTEELVTKFVRQTESNLHGDSMPSGAVAITIVTGCQRVLVFILLYANASMAAHPYGCTTQQLLMVAPTWCDLDRQGVQNCLLGEFYRLVSAKHCIARALRLLD